MIEDDPIILANALKLRIFQEKQSGETVWTNFLAQQINRTFPVNRPVDTNRLINAKGNHVLMAHCYDI